MAELRVLLIDDDPMVRHALRVALELDGIAVEEREDADACSAPGALDGIDVVLTDIVMPRADGLELIRTLRSQRNPVPIIAISGYRRSKQYLEAARIFGADAVMSKPVDETELVASIRCLAGRRTVSGQQG